MSLKNTRKVASRRKPYVCTVRMWCLTLCFKVMYSCVNLKQNNVKSVEKMCWINIIGNTPKPAKETFKYKTIPNVNPTAIIRQTPSISTARKKNNPKTKNCTQKQPPSWIDWTKRNLSDRKKNISLEILKKMQLVSKKRRRKRRNWRKTI